MIPDGNTNLHEEMKSMTNAKYVKGSINVLFFLLMSLNDKKIIWDSNYDTI